MSRIGNKPINIPENIEVKINNMEISVKGPKGELTTAIVDDRIKFEISENILIFSRSSDERKKTNIEVYSICMDFLVIFLGFKEIS